MISPTDALMRPLSSLAYQVGRQLVTGFGKWAARQAWETLVARPEVAEDRIGWLVNRAARAHADGLYDAMVASYLRGADETAVEVPPLRFEPLRAMFERQLPGPPTFRADVAKGLQSIATGAAIGVAQWWKAPPLPPIKPPAFDTTFYGDGEPLIRFPKIRQALRNLARRRIMEPEDFYRLSAQAKKHAFTISGGLEVDSIETGRSYLMELLRDATDRETFVAQMKEALGTLPLGEAHMEQVYRNNTNTAYSEGARQVLNHPGVIDAFPYRAYFAIHDDRARPEHLAMEKRGLDGTNIYHRTDPTWLRFEPPFAWNCRCGWVALTVSDAARKGVKEAIEWLKTGIEPPHKFVEPPPWAPPPGWDRERIAA